MTIGHRLSLLMHKNNFILPNVVLSGPSFGYLYSDKVLRVGEQGQLQNLLNLTTSVQREELEDLYVQQMLSRHESHLATLLWKRRWISMKFKTVHCWMKMSVGIKFLFLTTKSSCTIIRSRSSKSHFSSL